ncbi:DUF1493 family protein [Pseudomonas sp.]|uniref:DUF1493 family protein n=1 Tax=Pseudomonas sp. TaxID=306 RepID=UPI003C743BFD
MNFYLELALIVALQWLTFALIKNYTYRIGFGLTLLVSGLVLIFAPIPTLTLSAHESINSTIAFIILITGIGLIQARNKHRRVQSAASVHSLLRAPTMNLAPHFPEDPAMQQLLQLLHEEIGLPKHKAIRLDTSINFDLGCDGAEAKQFMEALEQDFALDLGDYDAYRYFQPPVFDVFLKRRAKGRGDKVPLTIGMLYLAIKTHGWDTQTLENLS